MRLLKPSWVSHDGHPIFSLDIHPDGTRFATGGQGDDSGRIVLWNMDPVAKEDEERNTNVPKMLCQMDNHLACVNCVRWSNNGKYLASGGDDKVIMIWQTGRYSGTSSVFGGGGKVNVEQWRSASTLRGHSGDILDLAWSSHDAWLASCSVDNTVVVWNANKFPEILSVLRGHSGLVKGVSWDPVGKYLASQSDDKTLQVWRTLDWQQEVVITEPFEECGGTTHVLRLSWSPDGQFLVSAHAMNNSGPTAQIIERDGWKTEKDFVGHRKAITVAKFNPNILSKVNKENSKVQQYCCCAIGSRDRSLSIWLTSLKRPLVVIHDLFANSISDVSWSRNGYQLMVCSWDGTVAYVDFSEEEIGHPLSLEEQSLFHQKKYGKSLAMTNHTGSVTTIIENPEMLKLKEQEKEKEQANQNKQQEQHKSTIAAKGPINKQIETRTADGRRRITPMFIAPAPDLGDVPLPFNSKSQPTFSSSTESKSKIIIEKRDEVVVTSNTRNSLDSSSPQSSRLDSNQANSGVALTPTPTGASSVPHNALAGSSDIAKASAVPATPLNSTSDTLKPLSVEKPKESFDKTTDKTKDPKLRLSEPILPIKRKVEEIVKPVKRRPGRPPLAEKLASIAAASAAVEKEPKEVPRTAHDHSSRIHLPALKADKYISIHIIGEKSESPLIMEVENSIAAASNIFVHRLKCVKSNSTLWEVLLPDKINAVTGNSYLVGVFCEDNTLSVFTLMGRRMFPALVLPGPVARLTCNGYYLMAITTKAHVFVWDTRKADIVIKNESLHPIMSAGTSDLSITSSSLTDHGCPIISLSTGKSFVFSNTLSSWMMVSNVEDAIQYCSDHQLCIPSMAQVNGTLLPLASLQSQGKRPSHIATRLFRNTPSMQQAGTLSYLDTQLASSLALHSGKEFKFWLLTLVRYLILEGLENRLREICNDLLGPITKSKYNNWEPYILGLYKRDLLQEILPMIGSNLRLQRLFTEYQEQLEMTKK